MATPTDQPRRRCNDPNPITLAVTTPLAQVAAVMAAHKLKRLPVVDASGRLVGLVGRAGVLAALSHPHDE